MKEIQICPYSSVGRFYAENQEKFEPLLLFCDYIAGDFGNFHVFLDIDQHNEEQYDSNAIKTRLTVWLERNNRNHNEKFRD